MVMPLHPPLSCSPPPRAVLSAVPLPRGRSSPCLQLAARVWAPAVREAGLEWCTPHALRHSQAALLIEAGEDPYGHLKAAWTCLDQDHLRRVRASAALRG